MSQTITSPVFMPSGLRSRSAENPEVPLSQAIFDDDVMDGLVGPRTTSGIRVSRKKALGYSAVWRAVNLISRKIAALPLKVFRAVGPGKDVDKEHPAYRLLRRKPNQWMTAMVFKQVLQSHALLRGNGYAYITRDADARPVEILPLNPEATWPVRRNGEMWYITEVPTGEGSQTETRRLHYSDVLHLRGLGFDGLVGYDVISILRETLGKAIATREHGARFFSNNAKPSIALEFPAGMKDEVVNNVVERWGRMSRGLENAHKIGILREGVKINAFSLNSRDSQLIENLTFDAVDIANVFGLPPRKVGLDQGGGYNSLFEENQSVHDDTIDPWCATWEEEADQKLLTEAEQDSESHACLFVRNAIMRSNPEQRSAYYTRMIESGLMNQDEGRALEELNPLPDGKGQIFYMKTSVVPVGMTPPAKAPADGDPQSNSLSAALKALLAETAGRMARRLDTQAQRKADLAGQATPIAEAFANVLAAVRAGVPGPAVEPQALAALLIDVAAGGDRGAAFEQICVDRVLKTVFPEAQP